MKIDFKINNFNNIRNYSCYKPKKTNKNEVYSSDFYKINSYNYLLNFKGENLNSENELKKRVEDIRSNPKYKGLPVDRDVFEDILNKVQNELMLKIVERAINNEKYYKSETLTSNNLFLHSLVGIFSASTKKEDLEKILKLMDSKDILPEQIRLMILYDAKEDDIVAFNKAIGIENAKKFSPVEIYPFLNFVSLINVESYGDYPDDKKRELLKKFLEFSPVMFKATSDELSKYFPILPKTEEEYALSISKLVNSIKTYKNLDNETIEKVYSSLFKIASLNEDKLQEESAFLSDTFPDLKDSDNIKDGIYNIQKTASNPKFKNLNEKDKKILLLTSLFYNNKIDPKKAFYILKGMNLDNIEEIKIFTLLKNKNWAFDLFSNPDNENINKIAYNFRFDNTFDLSCILEATEINFAKNQTKMATALLIKLIKSNIKVFQKNQPLLPVTKFPSASRINEAITKVNDDGSTNLKGIYKDKDGLIIIKYNEVENSVWEKIGFKRGTISNGIKINNFGEDINTGNIKFFVHGLDCLTQLANFEAFNMLESDALLSVSYAERPESKYRFFRPQGVILDTDNINIHTGSISDTGTGYKKTLDPYLSYIITDRKFIPFILKTKGGLKKSEYVRLIKDYQNKQFSDIYPVETRNKAIKKLAVINSNSRKYGREYNEFLITNPKPPMAVYAYSLDDEEIKNPVEFLNRTKPEFDVYYDDLIRRTGFLRNYAINHDIPFVIFGGNYED